MGGEAHQAGIAGVVLIGDGHAAHIAALFLNGGRDLLIGLCQRLIGQGFQLLYVLFRQAQLLQHGLDQGAAVGFFWAQGAVVHAAHNDALLEQAVGRRGLHERGDLPAAAGLAENGDVLRVAAELGNVVMHPLEGSHQVRVSGIAGVPVLLPIGGEVQVAQNVQAVVHGDHHHVPKAGKVFPVIGHVLNGGAVPEAAAVEPDHHRALGLRVQGLGPHVQILAVLVLGPIAVGDLHFTRSGFPVQDGADIAVGKGVPNPLPRGNGLGHLEPFGVRVLNAMEGIGAVHHKPAQLSSLRLHHRAGGRADEFFCHNTYSFIQKILGIL